jgi:hypothetical protein
VNGAKKKPLLSFPRIYSSVIPWPERESLGEAREGTLHSAVELSSVNLLALALRF